MGGGAEVGSTGKELSPATVEGWRTARTEARMQDAGDRVPGGELGKRERGHMWRLTLYNRVCLEGVGDVGN